jgi:hypothetical protein
MQIFLYGGTNNYRRENRKRQSITKTKNALGKIFVHTIFYNEMYTQLYNRNIRGI